jgi:hypothetical protein
MIAFGRKVYHGLAQCSSCRSAYASRASWTPPPEPAQ